MRIFSAILFAIVCFQATNAQTIMKKANKQYELYAFNLAIQSYLESFQSEKPTGEAMAKLADAYRHLNQMEEAENWYGKAVKSKDLPAKYKYQYGRVLMAQGKYEAAKKWFEAYAVTHPIIGNHYAEVATFAQLRADEPSVYKVSNLPINSPSSDFGPAFYKNSIVYASARSDIQKSKAGAGWTGDAQNRLFKTQAAGSGFDRPVLLHADIRNAYNEGPLCYSPDGKMVAFTKNNFVDGTRQIPSSGLQLSLFIAEVDSDGDWSNAKPFPHNSVNASTGYPAFTPDGKALYFASNRPDGFGGFDIYISYKFGNTWTTPENVGPVINTRGDEITPFMVGETLYFASDWHAGFGGYDIFRAEKTGEHWDQIFHLGSTVNSSRDDYGFIFSESENQGYFTSNRLGGKGLEDIYGVKKETGEIVVNVVNAADGRPLEGVVVDLSSCKLGVLTTDRLGKAAKPVPDNLNCTAIVKKEGYRIESLKVATENTQSSPTFTVALKKEDEVYYGGILHGVTNSGLGDVVVRVTNQASGASVTVNSDPSGKYILALSPNNNYVIRYSKAGFIEVNQTVKTRAGKNKDILGVIRMNPVGTTVAATGAPRAAERSVLPPSSEVLAENTAKSPAPPASDMLRVVEDKPIASDAKIEGFAVQIASVSTTDNINLSEYYTRLKGIGKVYIAEEDGWNKVRVGVYSNRREAEMAQKIIDSKGFSGSFIVSDYGTVAGSSAKSAQPQSFSTSPLAKTGGTYKVRLASYKNPKWFDGSKVSGLGKLEKVRTGAFTVMVLSGFESLSAAKDAWQQALQAGFKDAYVVKEVGGELKRVDL